MSAGWFRSNAVYNKVVDGKIQVEKSLTITNNDGTISEQTNYTRIYSNSSSSGVETNIDCGSILCSGDVCIAYFTNGVKDYKSGFLFGSSNNLANADKWTGDTIKTESSDSNGTLIDVPYQYNIPCNLVDVSGAGFRAQTTLVIETNLDKIFINDASVCDIITVRPVDAVGKWDRCLFTCSILWYWNYVYCAVSTSSYKLYRKWKQEVGIQESTIIGLFLILMVVVSFDSQTTVNEDMQFTLFTLL